MKRRVQKNIQNKAVQTKIKFIYQEIHEKWNITNIISSAEYSSVCVRVYVYVTNTNIIKKRLHIESVL